MKKVKILKSLFSKKRNLYTTVGKIIDFIEKVEDFKEKVDKKKNNIQSKVSLLKNTAVILKKRISTIKKEDFIIKKDTWDRISDYSSIKIKQFGNRVEVKQANIINNHYPLIKDIFFNYNLTFKNSDIYLRKTKKVFLKSLSQKGLVRKFLTKNINLYSQGSITEERFTEIICDLSYIEMMFGDYNKLEKIIDDFLKNKPPHLTNNWHLYFLGRMYFFSLLRWKTEVNSFTSYIRGNSIPFLFSNEEFRNELISYPNFKKESMYLHLSDLVWSIQLSNFSLKSTSKDVSFRREVEEVYGKIKSKGNDLISIYAPFFQYFLLEAKDSFSLFSFIGSIKRVNSMFSIPFDMYTGKSIEKNLNKDNYDSAEFIYFILMFNVFSVKEFYYDLGNFMRHLNKFNLSNSDKFIAKLRAVSDNTDKVFNYIEKELENVSL